jgi:hypothetical protein
LSVFINVKVRSQIVKEFHCLEVNLVSQDSYIDEETVVTSTLFFQGLPC